LLKTQLSEKTLAQKQGIACGFNDPDLDGIKRASICCGQTRNQVLESQGGWLSFAAMPSYAPSDDSRDPLLCPHFPQEMLLGCRRLTAPFPGPVDTHLTIP
jgi:hypothetical protein